MSRRLAHALRRRRLVLLISALGCAALVALPVIGLMRIDDATRDSHEYVGLVSTIDELTNGQLSLTTGALAQYGTTGADTDRARVVAGLDAARGRLAEISAQRPFMRELEIADPVEGHLHLAREHIAASEAFLAEIDAGANVGRPHRPTALLKQREPCWKTRAR